MYASRYHLDSSFDINGTSRYCAIYIAFSLTDETCICDNAATQSNSTVYGYSSQFGTSCNCQTNAVLNTTSNDQTFANPIDYSTLSSSGTNQAQSSTGTNQFDSSTGTSLPISSTGTETGSNANSATMSLSTSATTIGTGVANETGSTGASNNTAVDF